MTDYWNEIGLQCIENCKGRGMPATATCVEEIVEQRAYLLEALKNIADHYAIPDKVWSTAHNAITKAEVAE